MRQSMIKGFVLGVLCIFIALIGYFFWTHRSRPQLSHDKVASPSVHIPVTHIPALGDKNAPHTVVAFGDLKCENCKRFHDVAFPILQQYIRAGQVRYYWVNLAFLPGSKPIANAALCLQAQNNGDFFHFVQYIYQHQPKETEDWGTQARLIDWIEKVAPKADMQVLTQCMALSGKEDVIARNLQVAQEVMQPQGEVATPALYVDGRAMQPLTVEGMVSALGPLKHAKAKPTA